MGMQQAIDLINSSQSILLTGHLRADGDCLGAQIVLYYVFKNLGKEVQIMLPNPPDQRYGFLEEQTAWQIFDKELPEYDLLVACDCIVFVFNLCVSIVFVSNFCVSIVFVSRLGPRGRLCLSVSQCV